MIQKPQSLSKLDSDKMIEMLEEKVSSDINFDEQLKKLSFPNKQTKKSDKSDISFSKQPPVKKLDPSDMLKMLDNNEEAKTNKPLQEFYINESQRAFATIKFLDKKISNNPEMSSKKIEIINKLKKLYQLRGKYYLNKLNNDLEKNKHIDKFLIDNDINQLQDEFRYQEGSNVFTSQNEFGRLLILLTQLRTKANSKMLKDGINQLLKELYNSKQITKQAYNILNKVITCKNDS